MISIRVEVLLYQIGVDPAFQRRDIGKALIETCKEWARLVGAHEIWVLTEQSNLAAVALYQSTGGLEESPGTLMFVYNLLDEWFDKPQGLLATKGHEDSRRFFSHELTRNFLRFFFSAIRVILSIRDSFLSHEFSRIDTNLIKKKQCKREINIG